MAGGTATQHHSALPFDFKEYSARHRIEAVCIVAQRKQQHGKLQATMGWRSCAWYTSWHLNDRQQCACTVHATLDLEGVPPPGLGYSLSLVIKCIAWKCAHDHKHPASSLERHSYGRNS